MNRAVPEHTTLELIERGSPSQKPSLLFVHGYWQAAWTWDECVMPALAEAGQHCLAVSLRGHGNSPGKIRGASIADYVADVRSVVDTLDQPPILIGHSMGGFTVQHYLAAGNPATAAVLVSPVPNSGAWGATFKVARRHPWKFLKTNLTLDVGAVVETIDSAHDLLISPDLPEDEMARYIDRVERASYRTYMDMLLKRPDLSDVSLPALVVGGDQDAMFTVSEWRKTARALGAELVVIPGMGHQPMWDHGGSELTEAVEQFVMRVDAQS